MSVWSGLRVWLHRDHVRHATVASALIVTAGLLLNDAANDTRLAASFDSPAAEVPVATSGSRSAPAPLYQDLAAALPAGLPAGSLQSISTSPLSILLLVPPVAEAGELTACFYVKLLWLRPPPASAALTWIAPTGAVPLSRLDTERSCYRQPNLRATGAAVSTDPVSGLTLIQQSITSIGPDKPAVQVVSAVRWPSPLLVREGHARRRLLVSYDSEIPDTLDRLGLQALETYTLDFTGTRSAGFPTSRQTGVDLVVAVTDTKSDRILGTSILSNTNSGLRASWRTSSDQPRYDIALTIENATQRRELKARLQRSSLVEGVVAPFLLVGAAVRSVRSLRLRRSRRARQRTLIAVFSVIASMLLVIRSQVVPNVSDSLLRMVTGA